ncbi:hypothetical protein BT528P2_00036 [Bacteroides phage BT528P2]|nr:hypothetical protein BT498P1_00017 [Bacteroides phage BT498P1]WAX09327.1 hypothetical protein BT528P1_00036 [Bacteroides phage BT528P1]WAX09373.1 hypothetical protein BT528P2_00036 [Bacteroides phage BT528P2]
MKTRIKKGKALVNCSEVTGYLVQELGNDGMFRTIAGGVCYSKEDADKVRARYKRVGRDVNAFNKKFQHQTLTMSVDYQKEQKS